MATFISPGAYILERDDSLYAPAIAPTVIGCVGTSTKGPEDEATLVTSEGQLVEIFGRPRTKDLGMHAAIEALKQARIMYFIRISGASAAKGLITVQDDGSTATAAATTASNVSPYNLFTATTEAVLGTRVALLDVDVDNTGGGLVNSIVNLTVVAGQVTSGNLPAAWDFAAIDTGADVTLTLIIDSGSVQTITFTSSDFVSYAAPTIAEILAVVNAQLQGGSARAGVSDALLLQSDVYGDDSGVQITATGNANDATNGLNFATSANAGSGDAADLTAVTIAELNTIVDTDTTSAAQVVDPGGVDALKARISTVATGLDKEIRVNASSMVGASPLINWATSLSVGTASGAAANTVTYTAITNGTHSSRIKIRTSASAALAGTVKIEVLLDDVVAEQFDKLAVGPNAPAGSDDLITAINTGTTETAASQLVTVADVNPSTAGNPAVGTVTLSAGDDGDDWVAGDVIGTTTGSVRTGLDIFVDPDQVFINVLATPGISYASVIAAGINVCIGRADCFYVIDAPTGLTPAEVVAWHNGDANVTATVDQEGRTEANSTVFNSSYAGLYYPFFTGTDKYNKVDIDMPMSGVILRTLAYTDTVADPWFAPAGPNRTQGTSILDLQFNASQGERDVMQLPGNNVNPVIVKAGVGTVIMGQKTLQRAPTALDRVNVRRLLLSLEKSISQAVFFLMFEPNDPVLWRRFVNLVEPVLRDVQSRRGLIDFLVVADSTTTTPLMQNQNTFVGKIFLEPTKAAEKIVVSFNITPAGTDFSEFLSS